MEIAGTDSYDYRQGLKTRRTLLGGVLTRLDGSGEGRRNQ